MRYDVSKKGSKHNVAIMWDSVAEPRQYAEKIKNDSRRDMATKFAKGESCGWESPDRWLGAPSVTEFFNRLDKGWSEGADRLMKLAVREFSTLSVRRRRTRGDQGDEIDMQAVWRGDISRAWTRTRRQSRPAMRQVNIVCNLGASAGTSSDTLFWRGASALRLAAALSEAGYNVGIYGGEAGDRTGTDKRDTTVGQFIEIKSPDMPLDVSALAAVTCMAGFFRTSLFAGIVVGCDLVNDTASSSLGSPNHNLAPLAAQVGLTGCVFQPEVNSQTAAEEWIEKALAQIESPELEAA
jgi:hypothetical protein